MGHPLHDVELGPAFEDVFPAIIETPKGATCRYELDVVSGLLKFDQWLHDAVCYPANFGFIPRTIAPDDDPEATDPLDVLVLMQEAVPPLTIVPMRVIGGYLMRDPLKGDDDKIIAVAAGDPAYSHYTAYGDLPTYLRASLARFFDDYRRLKGKDPAFGTYYDRARALATVEYSAKRYRDRHED